VHVLFVFCSLNEFVLAHRNCSERLRDFSAPSRILPIAGMGIRLAVRACDLVLLARRLTDALAPPFPTLALIAPGIVAVGAVISIRILDRQGATKWPLSVALVLLAFSVSLPGTSPFGLALFWLAIVGEEVWAWQPRRVKPANHIDVAWRHAVDSPV